MLATHQLQYLKDVEHIVLMSSGKIEAQGSYQQLMVTKSLFLKSVGNDEKDQIIEGDINDGDEEDMGSSKSLDLLPETSNKYEELQMTGAVGITCYKLYFKTLQSNITVIWVIMLFITTQAVVSTVDYMVSRWVNMEEKYSEIPIRPANSTIPTEEKKFRENHTIIYTALIFILFLLTLQRSFSFFKMCLNISRKMHDNLFRSVVQATMTFFNRNPSGRILNRFSQDIGLIDTKLTVALVECITVSFVF